MARTVIPTTNVDRFGVSQPNRVFSDITNGMYVANNDGRMWVELANVSNAGSVNVTVDVPKLFDGDLTIADIIVAIAPSGTKLMGPCNSRQHPRQHQKKIQLKFEWLAQCSQRNQDQ